MALVFFLFFRAGPLAGTPVWSRSSWLLSVTAFAPRRHDVLGLSHGRFRRLQPSPVHSQTRQRRDQMLFLQTISSGHRIQVSATRPTLLSEAISSPFCVTGCILGTSRFQYIPIRSILRKIYHLEKKKKPLIFNRSSVNCNYPF